MHTLYIDAFAMGQYSRRRRTKLEWSKAIGAKSKARRLRLRPVRDGIYQCPIENCEHEGFISQRGCRKHINCVHGWYFYFDTKPSVREAFPEDVTRLASYTLPTRARTVNMPSFKITTLFGEKFLKWLQSDGGGGKSELQSRQICIRALKFFKYCCEDSDENAELVENVVDFCLGSVNLLNDFLDWLKFDWSMGYSGCIGYVNAFTHALDFRRCYSPADNVLKTFMVTEIYLVRVRKCLSKRMKLQWTKVLDIDMYISNGCWATLGDLQKVIPFHQKHFDNVLRQCQSEGGDCAMHDLTFSTSFITALLFLKVKATRPMTFQYLTIQMIEKVSKEGFIDQAIFKTSDIYGFDSLHFEPDLLKTLKDYINFIRPKLNPRCDYLLITSNGNQNTKFSAMLGRMTFLAIGKYINPTRFRQIIETESSEKLSLKEQQLLSEDQKHSSNVAKVHYKKLRSRDVSIRAKSFLQKMISDVEVGQSSSTSSTPSTEQVSDSDCTITHVSTRVKKQPFSSQEDTCLKKGIKKHGWGNWTAILKDSDYGFLSSRKPATLHRRANLRRFDKL